MNELERWLYLDGPEPELLRPVFEELADPEPTPEEEEEMVRGALARLDARLSSRPGGVVSPRLLDDAEVQSAPPTPTPALQKEEEKEEPPAPPPPVVREPSPLAKTANSAGAAAPIQPVLGASGVRPAPTVRVVGAEEHPRTLEMPVMDPSQGAPRAPPALSFERYVDFRTELELWPEQSAWVRKKYEMEDEARYLEVVRHWEVQIAASPQVRARAEAIRASCLEKARTEGWTRSGGG